MGSRCAVLLVAFLTTLSVPGCDQDKSGGAGMMPETSGEEGDPRAGHRLVFERDDDELGNLPAISLTYVIRSPDEREAGSLLEPGDPLVAPFRAQAEAHLARLHLGSVGIKDVLANDEEAERIWTQALRHVRVTRSRPLRDGGYDVVLQARILKLVRHIEATRPESRKR